MRLGRVEVTGSFLLLITWLNYMDRQALVPMTLFSCLCHEFGHCVAIWVIHGKVHLLRLSCIGAQIYLERPLTQRQEFFVALCGPAVNLLLANGVTNKIFSGINLALALFNLLPIGQMDGSRILHSLLSLLFSGVTADKALLVVGYALSTIVWLSALYLLCSSRNFTLFLVSTWLLIRTFLPELSKIDVKRIELGLVRRRIRR